MKSFIKKFFILFALIFISNCQILPNQSQDTQIPPSANNPQIINDKKINTDEEKKIINITDEEISSNNKSKSAAINKVIIRNKFEKIFEQTLGEKLNSTKIEIIRGDNCEPLKTNEKCLSVNPEQRSGQFDKYYFYLNGENNVYAITAFYNSRFGSQAECRTFIKEWENYFNKFVFIKVSNKKNQDQFVMVDGMEGEVIEVSMSCFNEKIRDISSTVSLNIIRKF
jgi:hypothetical protein